MDPRLVARQLDEIALSEDFARSSAELVANWEKLGVGREAVDPIIAFMEGHPTLWYGMPGALVHFMERFRDAAHDERIVESVERRPTSHTIWMLNRIINDTRDPGMRYSYISTMKRALRNPHSSEEVILDVKEFLSFLGEAEIEVPPQS